MEESEATTPSENFTSAILPVFFVKDILASLHFYRNVCGFRRKHFYDPELGREVKEWQKPEPSTFINSVSSAQRKIALNLPDIAPPRL
jgi:hypothetical protein